MKTEPFSNEYDVLEHSLQRLTWTEYKRLTQLLTEHALTLPQFLVLVSVDRRGSGCPIGVLADEMFQSHPTMTGIVDRLTDAHLVVREREDPEDRRKVVVNLTPEGRQLLQRARAARHERMRRALNLFSAKDRKEFLRLLNIYLGALEKEAA